MYVRDAAGNPAPIADGPKTITYDTDNVTVLHEDITVQEGTWRRTYTYGNGAGTPPTAISGWVKQ